MNVALIFPDDDHGVWTRARVVQSLPDKLLQQRPASVAVSLHVVAPSPSPVQHEARVDVDQLAKSTHGIRDRLHTALRMRIGPHAGLSVKVVARATGLTERTIENAMSGQTMPRTDTMLALVDFFDVSFANEVFAGTTFMVIKLADQKAIDAAAKIIEGAAILQQLQRRA